MKTILVFGTFDNLHDGHHAFLNFARRQGEKLVASVANDETVFKMKGKLPTQNITQRMKALIEFGLVDEIVEGDKTQGDWSAIRTYSPDGIVVGYDQTALHEALEKLKIEKGMGFEIIVAPSHEGDRFHTSLLQGK